MNPFLILEASLLGKMTSHALANLVQIKWVIEIPFSLFFWNCLQFEQFIKRWESCLEFICGLTTKIYGSPSLASVVHPVKCFSFWHTPWLIIVCGYIIGTLKSTYLLQFHLVGKSQQRSMWEAHTLKMMAVFQWWVWGCVVWTVKLFLTWTPQDSTTWSPARLPL